MYRSRAGAAEFIGDRHAEGAAAVDGNSLSGVAGRPEVVFIVACVEDRRGTRTDGEFSADLGRQLRQFHHLYGGLPGTALVIDDGNGHGPFGIDGDGLGKTAGRPEVGFVVARIEGGGAAGAEGERPGDLGHGGFQGEGLDGGRAGAAQFVGHGDAVRAFVINNDEAGGFAVRPEVAFVFAGFQGSALPLAEGSVAGDLRFGVVDDDNVDRIAVHAAFPVDGLQDVYGGAVGGYG